MAAIRIKIGNTIYQGNRILSGNIYVAESIIGDSMGIDTFETTLRANEDLTKLAYGTSVLVYHGPKLLGKFFLRSCEQIQADIYTLDCVSGVGVLDEATDHYGGIYNGETLETVVGDIIGGLVPYTVKSGVASIRVYGYLPIENRRKALRQVLYPHGVSLVKDVAGDIVVDTLDIGSPVIMGRGDVQIGGSIKADANVTGVIMMEHQYRQSNEAVTLYSGAIIAQEVTTPKGAKVSGAVVTFKEPAWGLSVTGATILESGANYAVLSSSGNAVLTGKAYLHTTREVYAPVENATGKPKIIRVEDATIVNATNADALARRVAQYYANRRIISVGMKVGGAKPGDAVTFRDPFGKPATALMMSMDMELSGTLMADAELVTGYAPSGGTVYKQSQLLQGSGYFTVPAGVYLLHGILISQGEDGQNGEDGQDGGDVSIIVAGVDWRKGGSWSFPKGIGGAGGKGGEGGAGGRILQVTMSVTPGQRIYYNTNGVDAVFGSHSSASGAPSIVGYTDIFTGITYAMPGAKGMDGGKGGDGGEANSNGWGYGQNGEAVGGYSGGTGTSGSSHYVNTSSGQVITHWGGGGGGGATCGDPLPWAELPGAGGAGGHGGGGGGAAGGGWIKSPGGTGVASSGGEWLNNYGGSGGGGYAGMPGGPAGVLLYF